MWILRVYLRSGPMVELIYDGAEACRSQMEELNKPSAALRDSYGKTLTIGVEDIAAVMVSDYDAELAGVEKIEQCKAGLRAKMQARAQTLARPMMMPGNGQGIIHP